MLKKIKGIFFRKGKVVDFEIIDSVIYVYQEDFFNKSIQKTKLDLENLNDFAYSKKNLFYKKGFLRIQFGRLSYLISLDKITKTSIEKIIALISIEKLIKMRNRYIKFQVKIAVVSILFFSLNIFESINVVFLCLFVLCIANIGGQFLQYKDIHSSNEIAS